MYTYLGEKCSLNKIPCNELINHSYEEISVSETRRQILEESRERHGGQRKRSEITIPIARAETEKNGLSKGGQTRRVNSITGGVEQNKKQESRQRSPQNGALKAPSQKISNEEVVAIKEYENES